MYPPMPAPSGPDRERSTCTVVMIVATVLYVLSLAPWSVMLMMSPMLYDNGASAWANVLVVGILGWPVVIAVGLVVGWRRRRYKPVIWGALAPVIFAGVVLAIVSSLG